MFPDTNVRMPVQSCNQQSNLFNSYGYGHSNQGPVNTHNNVQTTTISEVNSLQLQLVGNQDVNTY